jgi:uncharacterized cupin superfamily protein
MTTFHRLSANGTGQLDDWGAMPSEDLIAGTGQQFGHLWLDDAAHGLMVGVWACSPMTGRMDPWSSNEIMILLEGSVVVDHADGTSFAAQAGDAFFIPKGTVCSWRQAGDLKKFFVIHSDASGLAVRDSASLKARKIDPAAVLAPAQGPDASLLLGAAPECAETVTFTDLTGQLSAGVWRATPYRRRAAPSPRHELMHILEGEVTLEDGAGRSETFRAGETCFVPMGAAVGWSSTVPVRKVFATFTPSPS